MKHNGQQGGLASLRLPWVRKRRYAWQHLGGIDSHVERAMRLKAVRSGTINLGYYARSLVKKKMHATFFLGGVSVPFTTRHLRAAFESNVSGGATRQLIQDLGHWKKIDAISLPLWSFLNHFEAKDYILQFNIDEMRGASVKRVAQW